jgi:hypothetical protein
MNQHSKP